MKHIPAWKRHKIAEAEAARNAPPVAGQALAAIIAKMGDCDTDADKRAYLAGVVERLQMTPEQAAYVARVANLEGWL